MTDVNLQPQEPIPNGQEPALSTPMPEDAERVAPAESTAVHKANRKQIRGSSLLLSGRLISTGTNFLAQVLIVRYLSTTDYGAWAYALSIAAFLQTFVPLGLDRATSRFVPIYHEKHEYDKMFGTMLMVFGTIFAVGVLAITAFFAFPEQLARLIHDQQQPVRLVFILIFLAPVDALDALMVDLFACFSNARAIFFRRYVLAPGLKMAVVLLLIFERSGATLLAYGYLAASTFGVLFYGWMFLRMLRKRGLLEKFDLAKLQLPAKEVLSFTIPLLTSDLVMVTMQLSAAMMLGYFHDVTAVAFFRVTMPLALLNRMVMNSFSTLYKPAAARLFARGDYEGINKLYWQSAVWIAALTFPVFAATFSLAKPLTIFLYGNRYAGASVILALLSLGYYFDAALGNNGLTLKVLGKIRYIVTINILVLVGSLGIQYLLIPRYGALGAGIGTAASVILYNILKQTGLRLVTGVSLFDKQYAPFYLTLVLGATGLLLVGWFSPPSIYVVVGLTALVSIAVLAVSRKKLRIAETFPELAKLPLMRLIFA